MSEAAHDQDQHDRREQDKGTLAVAREKSQRRGFADDRRGNQYRYAKSKDTRSMSVFERGEQYTWPCPHAAALIVRQRHRETHREHQDACRDP